MHFVNAHNDGRKQNQRRKEESAKGSWNTILVIDTRTVIWCLKLVAYVLPHDGICCRRATVCVCVCLSHPYCIKTARPRITQTSPHNCPWTQLLRCQINISAKFERGHPQLERQTQEWQVKISDFRPPIKRNTSRSQN